MPLEDKTNHTCSATIIILICLMSFSNMLFAQSRFKGELITGINAAQIFGDSYKGFKHYGLMLGVSSSARLTNNVEISLDLLYDRRGSSDEYSFQPNPKSTSYKFINLDYISLPLYIKIKDWTVSNNGFHRIEFISGFSYARAFNISYHKSIEGVKQYKKTDISWLIGATFRFNKHFGLGVRHTRSIIPLYKYINSNEYFIKVRPYHLSVFTSYII